MGEKGFGALAAIRPAVEENYTNRLLEQRRQLHEQFLALNERYTKNPAQFGAVASKIKEHVDSVEPLFSTPHTTVTDLEQIKKVLASVQQLIENPLVAPATKVIASASEVTVPSLSQLPTLTIEMTAPTAPVPESAGIESLVTVEHMKSSLDTLNSRVDALYDEKTVPLYQELTKRGLQEHPDVKKIYGKDGKTGLLVSSFVLCASARDNFVEKLEASKDEVPSAELTKLHKKFSKQVAVLQQKVEWHVLNMQKLIESEPISPAQGTVTVPESPALEPLILGESLRVDTNPAQKLTMVTLPEAELQELNEVHRMENVVGKIEEEMSQLRLLATLQPAHEAGHTQAMIDQFKRTLSNYYVQPTPKLFKGLEDSFATIEIFHRKAKEMSVDIRPMLADIETYQHDLSRLESLPSYQPLEQGNLRALIANFHSLRARYVKAETGEDKIMLLRLMIKMHDNIKQAHQDAESFVEPAPTTELDALKKVIDELLTKPNIPASVLQSVAFVQKEMISQLEGLSPSDPQYITLQEKIKDLLNAAQQMSDVEITVAPTPKIEVAANHNLAPKTKERLIKNPKLVAALALVIASVVSPEKLSEYGDRMPVVSADIGATLNNIGSQAVWGTEVAQGVPVGVDEVTNEVVRIPVHPYTREVAEEEARMTSSISAPAVLTETMSMPIADTREDSEPSVAEVAAVSYDGTPSMLESVGERDLPPQATDTVPNTPTAESITLSTAGADSKESIATTESIRVDNTVIEVIFDDKSTLPDRAIDTVLDTVDTKGLPEVLVTKLKADVKITFLNNAEWLREAGVKSGEKGTTFPGEKIDYYVPKQSFEQRINEYRQYLNTPHTEVAVEDDNLTKLVEKSFARDLAVLSEVNRLPVVEEALAAYLATPGALEKLRLTDKDMVPTAAVVPLQVMAQYLADAVAKKVLTAYESGSASEVLVDNSPTTETAADESIDSFESDSAPEILIDEEVSEAVTSPETYPGGVLEYSKAFNEKLALLGIAPKAPSMIDSWFQPRTADNRGLLEMTVGELNRIMLQKPQEVMQELGVRNIALPSAEAVNALVREARQRGVIPSEVDVNLTIADLLQAEVLAAAPKK